MVSIFLLFLICFLSYNLHIPILSAKFREFLTSVYACNHYPVKIQNISITPEVPLCPFAIKLCSPVQVSTDLLFVTIDLFLF